MTKRIEYGKIMRKATIDAIRKLLSDVACHGLPGDHHFFITFDMNHPSLEISNGLREKYPEEMTIVLQHWFKDLSIKDEYFTVTLNFSNQLEPMKIPFDALKSFVDPSVEFILRFQNEDVDDTSPTQVFLSKKDEKDSVVKNEASSGEIVNLESFRKPKSRKD